MGTSTSNKGARGKDTPLVPTWLDSDATFAEPSAIDPTGGSSPIPAPQDIPAPPSYPTIPPAADPNRFRLPRSNFSRFARSGGSDRASLGRAVSGYIKQSSGGPRNAARSMGSSRKAGARLLGVLSDVAQRGVQEVLRSLKLESLAGRPIEELFTGLADYICPEGGTVDAGIARESFIRTIADLAESGITDLNNLNIDQIQTVVELYTTHTIEEKLYNEIGTNGITLPADVSAVENVQKQLHDFIQNSVADALTGARTTLETLTPDRVLEYVDSVYEQSYTLLAALAEAESKSK